MRAILGDPAHGNVGWIALYLSGYGNPPFGPNECLPPLPRVGNLPVLLTLGEEVTE